MEVLRRNSRKARGRKSRKQRTLRGGEPYNAKDFQDIYGTTASSLASMKDNADSMKSKADMEAKKLAAAYSGGKRRRTRKTRGGGDYDPIAFQNMFAAAKSSLASMKDKASEMKDDAARKAEELTSAYSGGRRRRRTRKTRKGRKSRRTRRHK